MPTYGLYLSTLVHEFIGIYVRKLSKLEKEKQKTSICHLKLKSHSNQTQSCHNIILYFPKDF